jgi:hypothetical protein
LLRAENVEIYQPKRESARRPLGGGQANVICSRTSSILRRGKRGRSTGGRIGTWRSIKWAHGTLKRVRRIIEWRHGGMEKSNIDEPLR